MRKILTAIAVIASVTTAGVANAAPIAPWSAADTSGIIQVAQGCGPGYARGPMGRCRPMGYGRPGYGGPGIVVRPPVIVRPGRVCPPGFAFRFGRCRPF